MPKVKYPMNSSVYWNSDEKTIGIVGVAPFATASFYKTLIELVPAEKEWQHPRVIIDSNPKIPSRGRHFELGEANPSPYIRQSIKMLESMGAEIIAVPCNTAHLLFDEFTKGFKLDIINIIEATVAMAVQRSERAPQRAIVLGSRSLKKHQIFEKEIEAVGGSFLNIDPCQADISEVIEGIKKGEDLTVLGNCLNNILSYFQNADAIILGCTELSYIKDKLSHSAPIIDCNYALACKCLELSNNEIFQQNKHLLFN